ncbi:MAG: hypothetical protein HWN68_20870 [Desulfobacterales bacterium]|nr:hypothetical protein [Desulfobacterales bacterium]
MSVADKPKGVPEWMKPVVVSDAEFEKFIADRQAFFDAHPTGYVNDIEWWHEQREKYRHLRKPEEKKK